MSVHLKEKQIQNETPHAPLPGPHLRHTWATSGQLYSIWMGIHWAYAGLLSSLLCVSDFYLNSQEARCWHGDDAVSPMWWCHCLDTPKCQVPINVSPNKHEPSVASNYSFTDIEIPMKITAPLDQLGNTRLHSSTLDVEFPLCYTASFPGGGRNWQRWEQLIGLAHRPWLNDGTLSQSTPSHPSEPYMTYSTVHLHYQLWKHNPNALV